jgi:hypothetical protein
MIHAGWCNEPRFGVPRHVKFGLFECSSLCPALVFVPRELSFGVIRGIHVTIGLDMNVLFHSAKLAHSLI